MTVEEIEKYDIENPQIWEMFVRFTFEAIQAGKKMFSAEAIINRLRWESVVTGNDDYKINNDLKPYFARKFVREYPQYDGFFEFRKSKIDGENTIPLQCRECHTETVYLKHKTTGKKAPIEVEPNENGNILVKDGQYRIATKEEIAKAKEIGHPLYLNHFASCKFAASFAQSAKK